jgi:hypothetical protein
MLKTAAFSMELSPTCKPVDAEIIRMYQKIMEPESTLSCLHGLANSPYHEPA